MSPASLYSSESFPVAGRTMASVNLTATLADVRVAGGCDPDRPMMEHFVAKGFLKQYGANVTAFMPWLMGLSCDDQLVGVAGLRPAAQGSLFIEQYLDRLIEDDISLHTGSPVERRRIVEIGNLAGDIPGVTRSLFPLLTELLYMRDYHWGVCNATHTVKNALSRLGIPFVSIARALPERLGAARFAWGSYYSTETSVIVMSTSAAHDALLEKPALAAACALALKDQYGCLPVA